MICPDCRTPNPDHARFCLNCGVALVNRCANCGAELPAGARFCTGCGEPVGGATQVEAARHSRLAAAAPAPLAQKMQAPRLTGERKVVTALFADVVGSTALAERLDPEDWTALMNGAFDRLATAVYRYEGTIARLLGDALLAFFGAPVTHEDDPVRSVRAALDMIEAARSYAADLEREQGLAFAIRVGLNTGPVFVGPVGSDLKYEYTALGDAVNLASRLQSAARPMTVLISEHTHRFVAPFFDCADLGPLEVRGKAEPVRVYEVRGVRAAPGRARPREPARNGAAPPRSRGDSRAAPPAQLPQVPAARRGARRLGLELARAGPALRPADAPARRHLFAARSASLRHRRSGPVRRRRRDRVHRLLVDQGVPARPAARDPLRRGGRRLHHRAAGRGSRYASGVRCPGARAHPGLLRAPVARRAHRGPVRAVRAHGDPARPARRLDRGPTRASTGSWSSRLP